MQSSLCPPNEALLFPLQLRKLRLLGMCFVELINTGSPGASSTAGATWGGAGWRTAHKLPGGTYGSKLERLRGMATVPGSIGQSRGSGPGSDPTAASVMAPGGLFLQGGVGSDTDSVCCPQSSPVNFHRASPLGLQQPHITACGHCLIRQSVWERLSQKALHCVEGRKRGCSGVSHTTPGGKLEPPRNH